MGAQRLTERWNRHDDLLARRTAWDSDRTILPPTVTKAPSLSEYGAAGVHRRDRVYVTTSQAAALLYAAGVNRGVIYECEPVGDIEPDPDCSMPGLSGSAKRPV